MWLELITLAILALLPPTQQQPRWLNAGLRKLEGRHLTLFTDLPAQPAIDELPRVFDLAVQQWTEQLDAPAELVRTWRVTGFLIGSKERFRAIGLPPADLPPFRNGYQRGDQLWVYEQPSDYYRRHLLLHEGLHGFMQHVFHGGGPPWFMEGLAELLATHQWDGAVLKVGVLPPDREAAPQWGRIKIVRDGYASGQARTLPYIMKYSNQAHLQIEPYGWCWAASYFLSNATQSREAFHQLTLATQMNKEAFNKQLMRSLEPKWNELSLQWQLFITDLDYGYDLERELVRHAPAEDLPEQGAAVRISATHGWQSAGIRVKAGKPYTLSARGRYQIGDRPRVWWCEPNGVTIDYHQANASGRAAEPPFTIPPSLPRA